MWDHINPVMELHHLQLSSHTEVQTAGSTIEAKMCPNIKGTQYTTIEGAVELTGEGKGISETITKVTRASDPNTGMTPKPNTIEHHIPLQILSQRECNILLLI